MYRIPDVAAKWLIALVIALAACAAPTSDALANHQANVRACAHYESNNEAAANMPFYLWRSVNDEWRLARTGKTNSQGCGQFNDVAVPGIYIFQVYKLVPMGLNGTWFSGTSDSGRITSKVTWSWNRNFPVEQHWY